MLRKQSSLKLVGMLVLIAIGFVGGGAYWVNGKLSGKPQQEYETVPASKRDVGAMVQATGIVKAMVGADVKVGARMPGKVVELPINVGDRVNKGQVIARIEQDDLVAKVKLQKAVLAEAKAEEIRLAKDFERDKQLSVTNAISPQKLDQSEAQHEMAKARTLKSRAELDYWESQLSYATIAAPIKGTVASVNTMQGETVVTGLNAPTFIRIIDLDHLEVLAYVDENDIGKVQVDQEATFTVAAHQATEFQGKVTSIYPSATIQDNVVYYITSVSVDNRGGKLRPDMTVNVSIFINRRKGVVTVPHKAVQRDGSRKFVFAANNGLPEKRFLKIGLRDQSYIEILDGLKEGELVIIGDPFRK
ncbi:MAG: efflux RND transporter periplasmic adaptor subunit [Desulfomonile tiedjei]|nr:efflux RND transporter periplasmic adaptor subunit [Desulfomonile tiedjei]